jgi:hypothetical protein
MQQHRLRIAGTATKNTASSLPSMFQHQPEHIERDFTTPLDRSPAKPDVAPAAATGKAASRKSTPTRTLSAGSRGKRSAAKGTFAAAVSHAMAAVHATVVTSRSASAEPSPHVSRQSSSVGASSPTLQTAQALLLKPLPPLTLAPPLIRRPLEENHKDSRLQLITQPSRPLQSKLETPSLSNSMSQSMDKVSLGILLSKFWDTTRFGLSLRKTLF